MLVFFKRLVFFDSFFLFESSINSNTWEVLLHEKIVKSNSSLSAFDKDHALVELDSIKDINQLSILLAFF